MVQGIVAYRFDRPQDFQAAAGEKLDVESDAALDHVAELQPAHEKRTGALDHIAHRGNPCFVAQPARQHFFGVPVAFQNL